MSLCVSVCVCACVWVGGWGFVSNKGSYVFQAFSGAEHDGLASVDGNIERDDLPLEVVRRLLGASRTKRSTSRALAPSSRCTRDREKYQDQQDKSQDQ